MNAFHRLHQLRMENDEAGYRQAEMRPRFAQMAGRHENGTAPRAVSAYQLFQTPPDLAKQLVALLELKPGARVLEPSAGLGRLLDAIAPYTPSQVVAVEIAVECASELYRQNRPGVNLRQCNFLEKTPGGIGLFDAVAMNPPFHIRSDIQHIRHALTFLKPGGRLAAFCMDTVHREQALRPLARDWIKIPAGAFQSENTSIATVMLTIDKP